MNIDDIPPHFLSGDQLPADNGMTRLEWLTYLLVAVVVAVFGLMLLLQTADLL